MNDSTFGDYEDQNYPIELTVKDTIYTSSASYLDLQLETGSKVHARTKQIISIFQLRTFHLCIATLRQQRIYLSVDPIFLGFWVNRNYRNYY